MTQDLDIEIVDWFAEALTGGWVKPSLFRKLMRLGTDRLAPDKYLKHSPDDLRRRYYEETLLTLQVGQRFIELPQVLIVDNTERQLPTDAFHIIVDPVNPEYRIPQSIAGKARDLLKIQKKLQRTHVYNSVTMRLNRVEVLDTSVRLFVSRAHYFDYLATNFSIDASLTGWTKTLRDTVHPGPRLCRLEESLLANHLGIGCLVFTQDGFLLLPVRSRRGVNIRRGEIGPAVSGTCDFDRDIFDGLTRVIYPFLREGGEELGLEQNDFDLASIQLLGITRELLRAGTPEMFFAAEVNLSKDEVVERFRVALDRRECSDLKWFEFRTALVASCPESQKLEYYRLLLEDFLGLLRKHGARMSLPALTNLVLWIKYKLALLVSQ